MCPHILHCHTCTHSEKLTGCNHARDSTIPILHSVQCAIGRQDRNSETTVCVACMCMCVPSFSVYACVSSISTFACVFSFNVCMYSMCSLH